MKNTSKKLLAQLLSLAMVIGLLAGCGGNPAPSGSNPPSGSNSASGGNSADPVDPTDDPLLNNEETINLTVFSQTSNWSGAQSGWAATLLKDKFNIELTIIPDTNGAYQTRMESKNLGDIIVWGSNGDVPGMGLYDPTTGTFYGSLEEGGPYLESLKFFNKLYRMGLIDPDSMTQTYDQMMPKMTKGNCLMSIFDYAGSNLFNTPEHIAENKIMLPLVPEEANVIVYGLSTGGNNRIWSIGNNTLYPEKCMQLINWLHTPEGAMTIWYGIKGLMWDYDENGGTYFTELGQACANDPSYDLTGVEWTSPETGKTYTLDGTYNDGMIQANNVTWGSGAKNPEANGESFHKSTWASQMGEPKNEADADWREFTGAIGAQSYMETVNYRINPTVSDFSLPEREAELELKWNQCKDYIKNGTWNAMYAKDDAEFNSIVAQMRADAEAYGYNDCVEWCKEQSQIKFLMQ